MKIGNKSFFIAAAVLSALIIIVSVNSAFRANETTTVSAYIKWVDFGIPYAVLKKAMDIDIASHENEEKAPVDWVEILAVLGTKYGGGWSAYKPADMDAVAKKLSDGETSEQILIGYKNYAYYYEIYSAVLGEFLGYYEKEVPDKDNPDKKVITSRYGLKVYSPVAEGYGFSHYEDFGDSRSYGYRRAHLGNDLCGSVGTPIVAMEAGVIEEMGWNQYGGWRVGIRSFDKKRYYYYAHLRSSHPFATGLSQGDEIQAGTVIGYLGMTGYSAEEGVNNMKVPHLHLGVQLIFDESQKDGVNQIWIDVYDLVELLNRNRATVVYVPETKDYVRKYNMYDDRFKIPE